MNSDKNIYIYPTDTVWGIGASIFSEDAQKRIASLKGVSVDKPLSILFTNYVDLDQYFRLPKFMDNDWLINFFKLETTLAVPIEWKIKEIPQWITKDSKLIAFRYLNYKSVSEITKKVSSPITTTSLNLTGENTIVKPEKAMDFKEKFCPDCNIIFDKEALLSGRSSSILKINIQNQFSFIRVGTYGTILAKMLQI